MQLCFALLTAITKQTLLRLVHKWKWRDMWPSMVTHTRNLCSAFNPSKVHTHTAVNTHTPWTHTRSSGQPFCCGGPGSSWGFGALLKGTSVVVLRVERVLDIHSPPTYNSCQTWDSNSILLNLLIKLLIKILNKGPQIGSTIWDVFSYQFFNW